MADAKTIALFGLGSMGFGMATSLVKAGHTVYGFDVNPAAVARFVEAGGHHGNVEDIGAQVDITVVVVLNAPQTESVLFGGNGIVQHMSAGSGIISCATMPPEFAKTLATRSMETGVHYLDAPISGGSIKAAAGKLAVMAAGTAAAFATAKPALDAMAETVFELGDEPGPGSAMKSVNQLLAGVHIAAMGEALTFGLKQGLSAEKILEVISQSAGNSWMFENRAPHVVAGDYTPHSAINIWLKDLGIVLDIAREERLAAPLAAAALQQYLVAAGTGLGAEDDAAITKVYARNAGVDLPSGD